MDYAGLDYRNIRFPVDRPLTEAERATRYKQDGSINASSMDFLSTIKFNSNYMDLVDRWHPIKGFNTWFGACVVFGGLFFATLIITAFFGAPATNERSALWFMIIVLLPISLGLVWGGGW